MAEQPSGHGGGPGEEQCALATPETLLLSDRQPTPAARVPLVEGGLAPGEVLGSRYRLVRRVGTGGMGTVYCVYDLDLEEEVALKLLHPHLVDNPEHRQRLRAEVRLARKVSHPNICRVHDIGQHDRLLFVTMELLSGETLRNLLRPSHPHSLSRVPLARRIDLCLQLCAGLSAAHNAGVLHRDVKPDNVIVEADRAVLTDFGIASLARDVSTRQLVAGTPSYIAPEVLRGSEFDHRVDIYACAVLVYEILTGRRPFEVPDIEAAVEQAYDFRDVPALPEAVAPLPVRNALQVVLERGLAVDPRRRTHTVDVLASGLAQAARGDAAMWGYDGGWAPARHRGRGATGDDAGERWAGGPGPSAPSRSEMHTPHHVVALEGAPGLRWSTPSGADRTGPAPATPSYLRAQVRVATALHFRRVAAKKAQRAVSTFSAPLSQAERGATDPLDVNGEAMCQIVARLGGTPLVVNREVLTAVFGAPVAHGDDAARAARAGLALIEYSGGVGCAGLHTARLLYRQPEGGRPRASGDALARAEQLACSAAQGELRASPATARHLVGRFRATEVATSALSARQRALLIHEGDASTARKPGEAFRRLPPFVGREPEIDALVALVRHVCETRSPGFATIVGAPGTGKSRLRAELERRLQQRRDLDVLMANATPLGAAVPLSLLRSADPDWFATAAGEGIDNRRAAFSAGRRWIELRAAQRPVVLFVEDAHWADSESLDFLCNLRRTLEAVPVAVIALTRPGIDDEPPGWCADDGLQVGHYVLIELPPLADESAREIVRAVAPSASDQAVDGVIRRAGGNPLFVEELARDLSERRPRAEGERMKTLPSTVEAVIQARLDRLPILARELACAAAVVGREFWREAARSVLAGADLLPADQIDAALDQLERRSIILALPPAGVDDDRYVFRNTLFRDVAYQQLPPRERRRAHAAVAAWMERWLRSPGSVADHGVIAAVAHHLDLAGDREGASRAYREAGEHSLALFAYREAAASVRRAVQLTEHPDVELLELLGDATKEAESVEVGQRAYYRALEQCGERSIRCARLCRKIANCFKDLGDMKAAARWYERGLAELTSDGQLSPLAQQHPTEVAALYGGLGWVLGYQMADNERGLRYGKKAVALLENTPHRRELARALSRLGANFMRAGRWREQQQCNRRNLDIGEELGNLNLQCTAHINLGVVYGNLGELQRAIYHTEQGLALAIRTGAVGTSALARSNLAGLLVEVGDTTRAERELDEAIRVAERAQSRIFLPESYGFKARLLALAGDFEAATLWARQALELASAQGAAYDEGIAQRLLGSILGLRGESEAALAAFEVSRQCLVGHDIFEAARTDAAESRLWARGGGEEGQRRAEELRHKAQTVFGRLGAIREIELLDDHQQVR